MGITDYFDWDDYPWANWAAQDANGNIYLYKIRPIMVEESKLWSNRGFSKYFYIDNCCLQKDWKDTLQKRVGYDENERTADEIDEAIKAFGQDMDIDKLDSTMKQIYRDKMIDDYSVGELKEIIESMGYDVTITKKEDKKSYKEISRFNYLEMQ